MGAKKEEVARVVLDMNILVSALLFQGALARLVGLWKHGAVVPLISEATFREFRTVLAYPKFRLTRGEIQTLIEDEILPFFEVVDVSEPVSGLCRDPEDDKFLACGMAGSADYIVSVDKDLCDIGKYRSIRVITASAFLEMFP